MQKTKKIEKIISFYRKNCKKEQFCFVFVVFLAFLTSKSEKATAAEEKNTIILQILLGNHNWSRTQKIEKTLVLQHCWALLLKILVPNATEIRQSEKTIGFIVFLPANVSKMNVLSILKKIKNAKPL